MGYCVHEVVSWYQKKIGAYDKQQWETTVEQRILSGFTHVAKKNAKPKTELIDVDLVRGSAFTKTKPKHGFGTVLRLAVVRLIFLPFYTKWWTVQTSFKFSLLLLLLYTLQIVNTFLYFSFMTSDDSNERVSASEVLVPFVMMLVLTVIHSLIICTHQTSSKSSRDRQNSNARRIKRTKRRNNVSRNSRPSYSNEDGAVEKKSETLGTNKYSKRLLSPHSSSEEGGDECCPTVRSRRVVVWDTTPVKTKSVAAQKAFDPVVLSSGAEEETEAVVHPELELSEQLAGVDHPSAKVTPQDDDGFESLNGNGSSDNNEEELAASCETSCTTLESPTPPPPCYSESCCDIRTPKISVNEPEITISSPTPPRQILSKPLSHLKVHERRFSAPPGGYTSNEHKDLADSEGSDGDDPSAGSREKKLLTPRRGSQQQLVTVEMEKRSFAESSYNSDSEEVESHESFYPGLTEGTTSAGEWIGITTNSEECSYSDASHSSAADRPLLGGQVDCDHPFAWEFEHSPSLILSPSCASSDKVSCTMWEKRDVKKADLSVLDISSAIIGRVEQIPDNMDYFYTGMVMSTLLSFLPSICRLCAAVFEEDSFPQSLNQKEQFPFSTVAPAIAQTSFNSTIGLISIYTSFFVNAAFSSVLWERYVILIGLLERLILGGFFFFLLTVAERTFKQRFLYAKFFSHLTSFRRAQKSELPHFRLNKVRHIKSWLSVRSYLRKRGPQRSVDVIVTATFIITLVLLTFLSFEILKDSFRLHSTINVEALVWCLLLGVFLLRFMTLGTKINHKYRNMSVLITEQINLYLQIEQKPNKKDELMLANSVLKLAADLLKELESPFKISGLSANPYLYTITKVCILSALSGVLSELLGFKLKLHKIKIK